MRFVDSHTEGEPTRVILDGWPLPAGATMLELREHMRVEQDHLRRAVLLEPRGTPAMVGALLLPPTSSRSRFGVVFFNNVSYLGMCGHGLIGLVRTLQHVGELDIGVVRVDTPAGTVSATLHSDGTVSFLNVPAYLFKRDVSVSVPGIGRVIGDVAYGGNWFFITEIPEVSLTLSRAEELVQVTSSLSEAIRSAGIRGADGALIDHIELSGPPERVDADSRNFVLCPGNEYDRSPCGTGTSAKLAVLHARGKIAVGEEYRQESITGSLFSARLVQGDSGVVPEISGRAFITATGELRFDPQDPFRGGLAG